MLLAALERTPEKLPCQRRTSILGIIFLCFPVPVLTLNILLVIQARGFQLHDDDDDDDSDDDYSDNEELQTPIDEVDPFIFFIETIQGR
jgi:hypothetical protein